MKILIVFIGMLVSKAGAAQELFTYTEPASNMPVKSFAVRMNNYLSGSGGSGAYAYSLAPEIMFGISKKLMLHGETFFGNRIGDFRLDGASVYAKYRFYSNDEVHRHFRMAVTAKAAVSGVSIMQPSIDLAGKNSGIELGLVATKLINRSAYSSGISVVNAFDNKGYLFPGKRSERNALNYNLSFGHLFLPAQYKDYEQVNMNGMVELLGRTNAGNGESFIDIAPAVQLIFLSKIRLDAGYRFPVVHSLKRMQDRGFLLRAEYNFFNVFR